MVPAARARSLPAAATSDLPRFGAGLERSAVRDARVDRRFVDRDVVGVVKPVGARQRMHIERSDVIDDH